MAEEEIQIRVHGTARLPTLVYLPGLHGDWTLVGGFRRALQGRVRFVELTYPRTVIWSLQDYARAVEKALLERGILRGWVIAESFGSQIGWPIALGEGFQADALVLAGGFGKHPARWGVVMTERMVAGTPMMAVRPLLRVYKVVSRWRFGEDPEMLRDLDEFVARRTEEDRQAAVHRLRLIRENDPGPLARKVSVPVYAFTGLIDAVVPWPWARRWLQANCPCLREYRVIRAADHTVLCTGRAAAARLVSEWMRLEDGPGRGGR